MDVLHIKKSCRIAEQTLIYLHPFIRPGITTRELDCLAEEFILRQNAVCALKGYKGFPAAICTSVNQVAAHGIPSARVLEEGDIVSLDVTVALDGWYGDAAWSYIVGQASNLHGACFRLPGRQRWQVSWRYRPDIVLVISVITLKKQHINSDVPFWKISGDTGLAVLCMKIRLYPIVDI